MKDRCVDACQKLLRQYEADGEAFLQHIITEYECWVHFYEPEWKRQSMEWRHTSSPKLKKVWVQRSAGKFMLTFFWDYNGLILRALHAQRKHCDQCHLLKPTEGKSEASYSPETAWVFDDGSAYPPRQCEATYCYSNSVNYWGAVVWVHPTPSVLNQPRAVGFSRLQSIKGCVEWNTVPRWWWGSVGGAWVAVHVSERILFPRNLCTCQALAKVHWTRRGLCWTVII